MRTSRRLNDMLFPWSPTRPVYANILHLLLLTLCFSPLILEEPDADIFFRWLYSFTKGKKKKGHSAKLLGLWTATYIQYFLGYLGGFPYSKEKTGLVCGLEYIHENVSANAVLQSQVTNWDPDYCPVSLSCPGHGFTFSQCDITKQAQQKGDLLLIFISQLE